MFSKLIAVYGILTFISAILSFASFSTQDTKTIISTVSIFVFSLTNTLVFGKLYEMQTDVQIMKNKLGIKDEEKNKQQEDENKD